jgi:hypothetical protein
MNDYILIDTTEEKLCMPQYRPSINAMTHCDRDKTAKDGRGYQPMQQTIVTRTKL